MLGYRILATVHDFKLHAVGDSFYAGDGIDPTNESSILLWRHGRGSDIPAFFTSAVSAMWITFKTGGNAEESDLAQESWFHVSLMQYLSFGKWDLSFWIIYNKIEFRADFSL